MFGRGEKAKADRFPVLEHTLGKEKKAKADQLWVFHHKTYGLRWIQKGADKHMSGKERNAKNQINCMV